MGRRRFIRDGALRQACRRGSKSCELPRWFGLVVTSPHDAPPRDCDEAAGEADCDDEGRPMNESACGTEGRLKVGGKPGVIRKPPKMP